MSDRPNILLLMSDQHHAGVGGWAGDALASTPTLDRLAAEGVSFSRAYCQAPVCTPSRMSLLCGKNTINCSAWNNHWLLFPEHRTLPQQFADAGYATCLVGKMHFGGADQYHGFQHRPYGDLRHGLGHQPDPIDMFPNSGGVAHAGASEIPESLQQEPVVSIEAAAWIREQQAARPAQPWFVCASYNKPHAPLICPRRYLDKYLASLPPLAIDTADVAAGHPYVTSQRENYGLCELTAEQIQRARAAYYGAVEFLDDCMAMLLWQLERAGALENTIIVYLSDHGEMLGHHGLWWKAIYYEEAIRVPLIMTGPGLPRGQTRRQLTSLTDLFPTLCSLAGLSAPNGLDGHDLSGVLGDADAASPHPHIISEFYGVAMLTQRYRSGAAAPSMRLLRTDRYKYVNTFSHGDLLFDLAADPQEYCNLIDDPAVRTVRDELSAALNEGFSWDAIRARIDADRERANQYRSGQRPSTPNQYQLADGRVFDAEAAMYDARWLQTETYGMAGIIPQMRH